MPVLTGLSDTPSHQGRAGGREGGREGGDVCDFPPRHPRQPILGSHLPNPRDIVRGKKNETPHTTEREKPSLSMPVNTRPKVKDFPHRRLGGE